MTNNQIIGVLKLEVARVGLFQGKPLFDKRVVTNELEIDVSHTSEIIEMFTLFAVEAGVPEAESKPQFRKLPNGYLQDVVIITKEVHEWTVMMATVVPPAPVLSEEEKKIKDIEEADEIATQKIFKVWRVRLDKFKQEFAKLSECEERTPEDERKYWQLKGAIDATSAFLTNLQTVRPVNQSVLNI